LTEPANRHVIRSFNKQLTLATDANRFVKEEVRMLFASLSRRIVRSKIITSGGAKEMKYLVLTAIVLFAFAYL
jgi:hypothetical protein